MESVPARRFLVFVFDRFDVVVVVVDLDGVLRALETPFPVVVVVVVVVMIVSQQSVVDFIF